MTKRVRIGGVSSTYIQKRKSLCLSLEGFKEFVIQDDQKIISEIFYGIEKFDKKDNKITTVTLRFSIPEYKKLKNFGKLSKTTVDLLHQINEYGKKHRLRNEVIVHLMISCG